MKFVIKSFYHFIQAVFIYIFFLIGKFIGLKLSRKIFSFIFLIVGPIFKSREVIEKNLNYFLKDIDDKQRNTIISGMWKNYGMTFIEYVFLDKFRNNNNHVTIEGLDNLKEIIEEKKPAIFVSGHFSNFELMSMEISKKKIKLATIYRPLNNIFLNSFMEYLRKKYICKNQIKKGINGVRDSINYIKDGYSIALMIDQRVSEGEKLNFFNKPALTTTLPAQLAKKYNLPIIPVFIERKSENFKIKFFKSINASYFKNKTELTARLNEILENMIKNNPREWIWTHNRWK